MTQSETYQKARDRAEAKYQFYVHVAVYVAVMVLLVVINMITSPASNWSIWPLIGWGLAVVLHGLRVFVLGGKRAIVDAMTEQEIQQTRSEDSRN